MTILALWRKVRIFSAHYDTFRPTSAPIERTSVLSSHYHQTARRRTVGLIGDGAEVIERRLGANRAWSGQLRNQPERRRLSARLTIFLPPALSLSFSYFNKPHFPLHLPPSRLH